MRAHRRRELICRKTVGDRRCHLSNHVRRTRTHDLRPDQRVGIRLKNQAHKTAAVSRQKRFSIFRHICHTVLDLHIIKAGVIFRKSNRRNLRLRINTGRHNRKHDIHTVRHDRKLHPVSASRQVFDQISRMGRCHMGKTFPRHGIADRIDIFLRRAVGSLDERTPIFQLYLTIVRQNLRHIRASADCHQHAVRRAFLPAALTTIIDRHRVIAAILDLHDLYIAVDFNPLRTQIRFHLLGNHRIHRLQQTVCLLQKRHAGTECREDRRDLHTDDTAADDRQTVKIPVIHPQNITACHNLRQINSRDIRNHRAGTGCQNHIFSFQRQCAFGGRHTHHIIRMQARIAVNHLHLRFF